MNNQVNLSESEQKGKNMALIGYILLFFTIIGGIIIGFLKKEEFKGTIYYSHFDNQIKIGFYIIGAYIITYILSIILVNIISSLLMLITLLYLAIFAWTVYQIVIGVLKLLDNKERHFNYF